MVMLRKTGAYLFDQLTLVPVDIVAEEGKLDLGENRLNQLGCQCHNGSKVFVWFKEFA